MATGRSWPLALPAPMHLTPREHADLATGWLVIGMQADSPGEAVGPTLKAAAHIRAWRRSLTTPTRHTMEPMLAQPTTPREVLRSALLHVQRADQLTCQAERWGKQWAVDDLQSMVADNLWEAESRCQELWRSAGTTPSPRATTPSPTQIRPPRLHSNSSSCSTSQTASAGHR